MIKDTFHKTVLEEKVLDHHPVKRNASFRIKWLSFRSVIRKPDPIPVSFNGPAILADREVIGLHDLPLLWKNYFECSRLNRPFNIVYFNKKSILLTKKGGKKLSALLRPIV
jgi:hypothetical protein